MLKLDTRLSGKVVSGVKLNTTENNISNNIHYSCKIHTEMKLDSEILRGIHFQNNGKSRFMTALDNG